MKLVAAKEALLPAFSRVIGATERKPTIPGPGYVFLEASGEHRLTARANDGEVAWEVVIEPVQVDPGFRTAVNAKLLVDVIRQAPNDTEIELGLESDRLVIRYSRSRFSLGSFPTDQVAVWESTPGLEAAPEFSIPASSLKALIEGSSFAMAQNDVRFYLQGLLLSAGPGSVRAVATDGHRLAMVDMAVEGMSSGSEPSAGIIPRKAVVECLRNLPTDDQPIMVRIAGREAHFVMGSDRLACRLIEGKYPDYERVIPPPSNETIVMEAATLAKAIQRVLVVSSERSRSVRIEFSPNGCAVRSASADREEAEEWVDLEYGGSAIEIGFNPQYLLDVLQTAGNESIRIQVRDSASSVRLETPAVPGAVYVVMPIRL